MPEFQEKLAPTVSLVTTIPTKETLMDVTPKKVVEPPHTASNGNVVFLSKLYFFYVKTHINAKKKITFLLFFILIVPFLNDDYDYYYDDLVASKSPVTPKPEIFQPSPRFVYIF